MVYFNALTGLLFTCPSRYLFTIDLQEYLALAVSSAGFPQAIRVLRYSRSVTEKMPNFRRPGCHRLLPGFPASLANYTFFNFSSNKRMLLSYNVLRPKAKNLGFSLFARRY